MVCQPAEVLGSVDIPSHIRFWGIDSGLRNSIGGADYGSVRIGSFMGGKMIKSTASDISSQSYSNGNGNNLDELEEFEAVYSFNLLDTLSGEAFLTKYDHHNDPVTVIDKKCSYGVKAAGRHPIYENFRVKICLFSRIKEHLNFLISMLICLLCQAFKALLSSVSKEEQPTALGELLYQRHYSYSACGLGSDGTDRLVQLVQEMQHRKPSVSGMDRLVQLVQKMQHIKPSVSGDGTLYWAKIMGGGSGGTICVIDRNCL